ncbi:hypothetical protein [Bacillus sp. JCM 19041]|uniref:hypothetical protein n=1 Tax=Bacillus sp. JCM 19041 TaxID=1460637 RepID=UPI0006CF36D2
MIIYLKRFAHALNDNNSVAIPTDLFNDQTLSADAIGLMLYLYSTNQLAISADVIEAAPLETERLHQALHMLANSGYIDLV